MLTIAHRLNAVMYSDRIMVMEEGKVSKHMYSGIYKYYGSGECLTYCMVSKQREQSEGARESGCDRVGAASDVSCKRMVH